MELFEVRYLEKNEKSFLMEMLYECIHIEEEKKPPMDELLNNDELRKYHQNWGRNGDKALIAVDSKGNPSRAVGYRLFSSEERGYGYVNENIPELGIAVVKEVEEGLGTKLMNSIIGEARRNSYKALSLSVDAANTNAVNLYRKLGFLELRREKTQSLCYIIELARILKSKF